MKRETRTYAVMAKLSISERMALEKLCAHEALPIAQIVRRLIIRAASNLVEA